MIIHYYKALYKNYFVAAFPMQPVTVQNEIRRWCYNTFGEEGYKVNTAEVRWKDDIKTGEVRFDRESDLLAFVLKWT